VIAVDTNLLVYAHRRDSDWHTEAAAILAELANGSALWALPWPCVHEFLAIVTHPRVFEPPSTPSQAVAQVSAWLESPSVVLLSESEGYWAVLNELVLDGRVAGPAVHDARVAALCALHGVRQLWTADRDFSRFPALRVLNPLVRRP
jgi:hypothetical protein